MTYTVWDVETSTHKSFKRMGNPFDPQNYVVMSGWKRKNGKVVGEYFGRDVKPADWFAKLLIGTNLLVTQNGKFDVLHALMDRDHGPANLAAWMAFVARGGNIWDCQLAEYLLEGMEQAAQMASLDDMAPRYGGNLKHDEVKALWEAGVDTIDIDPDLLRSYLCGTPGEEGDIGNTELVFLGQLDRARAAGQIKSILLNMGSLLCTIEMERNGMAVDKELGEKQAVELAAEIAELSIELSAYIPTDLPFDFSWTSNPQKSALIFGGVVKYDDWAAHLTEDGKLQYSLMDVSSYALRDGSYCAVVWGDEQGDDWKFENVQVYAGGKNAGEYKTKICKVENLEKPKGAITDFYYTFPGFTEPKKRWATGTPGQYKVGAEIIDELGNRDIPFLVALSRITALTKDLGTYYITTNSKGEQKGMLILVQPDGIIHHMLNHTSTVTARFSSSNPNLQNLPKEGKSVVKTLFVSRWRENGKVIQSDFTALEVYVQAILTRAKQLIADLKAGLDMHSVRVSQKEGIPYEEAYRLCVVEKVAEWVKKRSKAKTFSFERAYGAGATSISEKNKIPLDDVKAMIEAEEARYPEVERYYEKITADIKANSRPTNKRYPHPENPALICNPRKSYFRTPDNKLYGYEERDAPEFVWNRKGGVTTSFAPTEIKNYVVQGTGGEWAKAAMWLAIRAFYAKGNLGGLALLVNQVHDALYSDAHNDVALEAAALLEAAMVAASDFMEWYFEWNVPVPVPSATSWGANMMEEHAMPEGFSTRVRELRLWLREEYMAGYTPSYDVPMSIAA